MCILCMYRYIYIYIYTCMYTRRDIPSENKLSNGRSEVKNYEGLRRMKWFPLAHRFGRRLWPDKSVWRDITSAGCTTTFWVMAEHIWACVDSGEGRETYQQTELSLRSELYMFVLRQDYIMTVAILVESHQPAEVFGIAIGFCCAFFKISCKDMQVQNATCDIHTYLIICIYCIYIYI